MPLNPKPQAHGKRKIQAGVSTGSSVSSLNLDGTTLQLNQSNSQPQRTVDLSSLVSGDITGVTITTASNSGLAGGASATSGAFSATMTTDLNNLASATVNVANDSIAIIDADDSNGSKKESIADFVSGIAGTGLTASSGQLNASAGVTLGLVLALS